MSTIESDTKNKLRKVVRELLSLADSIEGTGCTFFACTGTSSGRIYNMITCTHCRSIIISRREANRIQKLLKTYI